MLGEQPRLYPHGNFKLLSDAALRFSLFRGGTSLSLDGSGDGIEADQRERVAVDVLEVRDHAAPYGRVVVRWNGLPGGGANPAQLRHGKELHAAPRPLAVAS